MIKYNNRGFHLRRNVLFTSLTMSKKSKFFGVIAISNEWGPYVQISRSGCE